MRFWLGFGVITLVAAAGCGSHVVVLADDQTHGSDTGGGGSGTSGTGGADTSTSTGTPMAPAIQALRAPDQTTVTIDFTADVAALLPADPAAFTITSTTVAPLAITSAAYDPAAHRLVLGTARQKLGAAYTLTITAPAGPLTGLGGDFLAADTARFWAADFGSPTFADYELVADRVAIGEHCVVYVEQGQDAFDLDEAVARFDTVIYPTETTLFNPPPDIDENGRIVLLGLDGSDHYGGYFSPIDTLPDAQVFTQWGVHSNETEMLYLNVAWGALDAEHVIPHEFSHLLYNAVHDWQKSDWDWHNEGLAECAVHAVNGDNPIAVDTVLTDPSGKIAQGISLVHWDWGNYDQYALSYLFWSYLAAQTAGDPAGYTDLFALSGDPKDIDAWIQAKLGKTFAQAQLDFLIALWAQAPAGPYGFGKMIDLGGLEPPAVPQGTGEISLVPFTGVFLTTLGAANAVLPAAKGPNITYAGVNFGGEADFTTPYAIGGGALIALNTSQDSKNATPEFSGFSALPAGAGKSSAAKPMSAVRDRAWLHPPPVDPRALGRLAAWRERTRTH